MKRDFIEFSERIHLAYGQGGELGLQNFLQSEINLDSRVAKIFSENYQYQAIDWEELKKLPAEYWKDETNGKKRTNQFRELGLELRGWDPKKNIGIWPKNSLAWILIKKVNPEAEFTFEIPEESFHGMNTNRIIFKKTGANGAFPRMIEMALDLPGLDGLPPSAKRPPRYRTHARRGGWGSRRFSEKRDYAIGQW